MTKAASTPGARGARVPGISSTGRRTAVTGSVILVVSLMSACQSADGDAPYSDEFEQARLAATTDFERDVLADDVITEAEFREAQELLATCVREQGYEFEIEPAGGYRQVNPEPRPTDPEAAAAYDQAAHDAYDTCDAGTTVVVEPLYLAVRDNPENVDLNEVWAECLVREGYRDPGYDVHGLLEEFEADAFTAQESAACFTSTP
ncbi:hypothetical protein ATJ88_0421 [Isoptericola jiangsuensis]|uniref:Uncharacterized protein n=1 Tax=Isoptericola jiangsuensis TaxID=548579 RepID=A0A2A9ESB7_9MICO|nr:hypothetical protein [Isoptericola jiangsuensis]PFG41778.1 hypothetical protein ATJ88_0421 [Isoptericola jiangsuensis]